MQEVIWAIDSSNIGYAFDDKREEGDKNSWSNLLGLRGYKVMLHTSLANLPGPTVLSSYLFLWVIYCKLMHIHSAQKLGCHFYLSLCFKLTWLAFKVETSNSYLVSNYDLKALLLTHNCNFFYTYKYK